MRLVSVLAFLLLARVAQAQPAEATPAEGDATASEPAPATESATEPVATESAPAAESSTPATRPKVALVLVGDPDDASVDALEQLTALLEEGGAVRMPTDPAMRLALAGRGEGDGLDGVRSERRSLGLSERRDLPVLVRLGRLTTAVAVVVVRSTDTGFEAVILDVGREAFFDGALSLPADVDEARAFVSRRARAAVRAVDEEPAATAPARRPPAASVEPTPDPNPEASVEAALAVVPEEDATPQDPVLQWFEQNWAYLAAGVLLAGGVAFIVVVAADDPGAPQPMLRFVPGE